MFQCVWDSGWLLIKQHEQTTLHILLLLFLSILLWIFFFLTRLFCHLFYWIFLLLHYGQPACFSSGSTTGWEIVLLDINSRVLNSKLLWHTFIRYIHYTLSCRPLLLLTRAHFHPLIQLISLPLYLFLFLSLLFRYILRPLFTRPSWCYRMS